jgi:uncharacterized metal-binding protein YceD (DUF177 family)
MTPVVNLRRLEVHSVHLEGELSVEELDIETRDEVIRLAEPLRYDLEVEKLDQALLAKGRLCLNLQCQCVRCLKPFQHRLVMDQWVRHLPLDGEDKVAVVNDCVDLTPYVREDILLEFPRHPLCDPGCQGLQKASLGKSKDADSDSKADVGLSAWAELNKLKI